MITINLKLFPIVQAIFTDNEASKKNTQYDLDVIAINNIVSLSNNGNTHARKIQTSLIISNINNRSISLDSNRAKTLRDEAKKIILNELKNRYKELLIIQNIFKKYKQTSNKLIILQEIFRLSNQGNWAAKLIFSSVASNPNPAWLENAKKYFKAVYLDYEKARQIASNMNYQPQCQHSTNITIINNLTKKSSPINIQKNNPNIPNRYRDTNNNQSRLTQRINTPENPKKDMLFYETNFYRGTKASRNARVLLQEKTQKEENVEIVSTKNLLTMKTFACK